jgi:hypothetical protein
VNEVGGVKCEGRAGEKAEGRKRKNDFFKAAFSCKHLELQIIAIIATPHSKEEGRMQKYELEKVQERGVWRRPEMVSASGDMPNAQPLTHYENNGETMAVQTGSVFEAVAEDG